MKSKTAIAAVCANRGLIATAAVALSSLGRSRILCTLATAAVMLNFSPSARSDVITFNGTAAPPGFATSAGGTTYTEAGFSLAISGTAFFVDSLDPAYPGLATFNDDVLEFNAQTDVSVTITKIGGGLFDLSNVMTGSLGRSLADNGNFIFTGTFGEGRTVSQTVLGLATPSLTTFSGFTGLSQLTVTTTDGAFPVMDNLTLIPSSAAVPGPIAGAGLPGLMVAALGMLGWRRIGSLQSWKSMRGATLMQRLHLSAALLCSSLASIALFAGGLSSARADTVFFDDFNAGASASWGNEAGNWSASGGVYAAGTPGSYPNSHSFVNTISLTNFAVNVDVASQQDGGIWLRAGGASNDEGAQGILLVFVSNFVYWHEVTEGGGYGPVLNVGFNPSPGNFSLHVEAQGNTFSAFINGSAIAQTTLTSNLFAAGFVGVYSNSFEMSFDNFGITTDGVASVPGPIVGAGLPGLLLGALGWLGWRRRRKTA
jgi:hypothetical protein